MSVLSTPNPAEGAGNRRRAGRVRCHEMTCQFGQVFDFSRTGAKVLTRKPIKVPGSETINLELTVAGATLVVPSRVVNNRKRPDGQYETGFAFLVDERWNSALATLARIASTDCGTIHQLKLI